MLSRGVGTGPVFFNMLICDTNEGRKYTLSKSADDMKIREVADTPKGFAVAQQDRRKLLEVQQKQVQSYTSEDK